MSNIFSDIGHGVEVAGKDVAKGAVEVGKAVADVFEFLPKAEAVIASAIKEQPEVKTAVLDLVKQATTVIGDLATDAADKGINLTSDAKTLADAESFFAYFKSTFIPLVEQLYGEIKSDLAN